MNEQDNFTIRYLLSKSLEGRLVEDEARCLDKLIIDDPQARRYYVEYLHLHVTLRKLLQKDPAAAASLEDEILSDRLWEELAIYEQTAESVAAEPLVQQKDGGCEKDSAVLPRANRKISRFTIVSFAASIAAVLLLSLYLYLVPLPEPMVATLTDSMKAQWADGLSMQAGDIIRAERYHLSAGMIAMTFESGAEVVIEGPAEFEPISVNKMNLLSGKAFARVSNKALGFVIDTPESSVVDMGTAFGVIVQPNGMEVHVHEGMVNLLAGTAGQSKQGQILLRSQARKVDTSGHADATQFEQYLFAQQISSRENKVVYGPPIDLTDFIIEDHKPEASEGIDPATGEIHGDVVQSDRPGSDRYSKVPEREVIDGVFVPNGNQVVTSAGHTFKFPTTLGTYWADITCRPYQYHKSEEDALWDGKIPMILQVTEQTTASRIILMHANAGITFDLNKIRQTLKGAQIVRFRASCGVSKNVFARMKHDYWVLLDGQLAWSYSELNENLSVQTIDIPIRPEQSYLTLATTDAGDSHAYDWCLFGNPVLVPAPKGLE